MPFKFFLSVSFFLNFLITNVGFSQQPRLVLPIGHTESIFAAQFSPDGKKVITVSDDNTIKLWDAEKGYLLADIKPKSGYLKEAGFSPDGKRIIARAVTSKESFEESENLFTVWDAVTGDSISFPEIYSKGIKNRPQFNRDGSRVVIISDSVRIWKTKEHLLAFALKEKANNVHAVLFSPGDKWLLTQHNNSLLKIWNVATGKFIKVLRGFTSLPVSIIFSANAGELTAITLNESITWNTASWTIKKLIRGKIDSVDLHILTPDAKNIITAGFDPANRHVKRWIAANRKFSYKISGEYTDTDTTDIFQWDRWLSGTVAAASSSTIAAVLKTIKYNDFSFGLSNDKTIKLWDLATGKLVDSLVGHTNAVRFIQFSPDGNKIITTSDDQSAKIWGAASGKLLVDLGGLTFNIRDARFSPAVSPDDPGGNQIITTSDNGEVKLWDAATGILIKTFTGNTGEVFSAQYSKDGKKIITGSRLGTVYVFEIETGKAIPLSATRTVSVDPTTDEPENDRLSGMIPPELSPDGKMAISAIHTTYLHVYDAETGKTLHKIAASDFRRLRFAHFSNDGKKIITGWIPETPNSADSPVSVWEAESGSFLYNIKQRGAEIHEAAFSADSKKIFVFSNETNKKIAVWNAENGMQSDSFLIDSRYVYIAQLSSDNKKILLVDNDEVARLINAETGKLITSLKEGREFRFATFSPDNKKIATLSPEGGGEIWDAETGQLLRQLKGHKEELNIIRFSPDMKKIITSSLDNTAKVWDAETGKCLYTFFSIGSNDYLVVDTNNHYDGTEAARNMLHYIKDGEVITLEQVKVNLWVPGLVERLNKGETIKEKSLEQLAVFGDVIPETEATGSSDTEFSFSIKPGKGGLGDIYLYVNNIEVKRFKKTDLKNNNGSLELTIKKDDLKRFFVSDDDNWISVKAKTADNKVSSKEARISIDKESEGNTKVTPNLYAVMIGTSRYNSAPKDPNAIFDTDINLSYPAIDAKAISQTVEMAAKKMLNNDGRNHVFMYNITTDSADRLKPNKKSIRQVLDSIGKKAEADDILLIFLSGHGVLYESDEKKQFYYLTAEASSLTDEKAFPRVGICTDSLMEWIRLENIPANKRILILDACYSGQVINDLKKDIDRLKENSKLFILSASASNKLAFESDEYEHGYLTYSLLKVIKKQPDILLNSKLNISRWFNAAALEVKDIAGKENNNQVPHIITVVDFNIGTVDSAVIQNIRLAKEKPLFVASNFQNSDPDIIGDDLGLGSLVNEALRELNKSAESNIEYADVSSFTGAYTIAGKYIIRGNDVEARCIIKKGKEVVKIFDNSVKGQKDKLKELVSGIIGITAEWLR
ncbi:MAG: hypothetical protein ACRDEB_03175 [Chitinophagaceae bacterium]